MDNKNTQFHWCPFNTRSRSEQLLAELTGTMKKSHLSLINRELCNTYHNFVDHILKYLRGEGFIMSKVLFYLPFLLPPVHTQTTLTFYLYAASYSRLLPFLLYLFTTTYISTLPFQHSPSSFTLPVHQERLASCPERQKPWGVWFTPSCLHCPNTFQEASPHGCAG